MRRHEAKVSYLCYPGFESDPHPSLQTSVRVDLRSFHLKYRDFSESQDPPILHRKELFVPEDYPERSLFASLTASEEVAGLFSNPEHIGTRGQWQELLEMRGFGLRGHTLLPRSR
jgi:DNA phosphorothioation-associated putative methyltransferase